MSWICCQLGAREHYAVPRALHRMQSLRCLFTDFWIPDRSAIARFYPQRVKDRYHPELRTLKVISFPVSHARFELQALVRGSNWNSIIERNRRFQREAVRSLTHLALSNISVLFTYSYAALEILRFARDKGWKTVLGQVDAGPAAEHINAKLRQCYPEEQTTSSAPSEYWQSWRQEAEIADRILVNSGWARRALIDQGVHPDKINLVPLAYEAPAEAAGFQRTYPEKFTSARPFRVLFLGQINLLKGVAEIFQAIDLLQNETIEFWFVGPPQISVPAQFGPTARRKVRWVGKVPRHSVGAFYRDADIFLFPSHSDGFGLTQLEAQAWKLPVIASQNCGDVVVDGRNGHLLNEVTGECIANLLTSLLREPSRLVQLSNNAAQWNQFGLERLGRQLSTLG